MTEQKITRVALILGPLLFFIILSLDLPLTLPQHHLAAIMTLVMCWWLCPTIPLPVTGFLGVSLATILGVAEFPRAVSGYANPVIFLFMGGFFIAEALKVNELDLWIARKFLSWKLVRGNPQRLFLGIVFLATLFSSILSNTATAAMFMPITMGLFGRLNIDKDHPSAPLLLMVAWASTIGGVGTPIGSTPNVLGISLLKSTHGISVSFFGWMMKGLPLMIIVMLVMIFVFRKELRALGNNISLAMDISPIRKGQQRLLVMLLLTICLWMLPGLLQLILGLQHPTTLLVSKRIPEGLVAIAMSSLLFLIPSGNNRTLLKWSEATRIDWGTLFLFGSGIALGQMMFDSGLARLIGEALPFSKMPFPLALFIITAGTLFFTEIASNTATANLMIPVLLSTSPFQEHAFASVMCAAMAANMAFMLPIGTPPNAIAFGTGQVKLPWMIKKGFWLNIVCILCIWILGLLNL